MTDLAVNVRGFDDGDGNAVFPRDLKDDDINGLHGSCPPRLVIIHPA
jgi:hypothetical protein